MKSQKKKKPDWANDTCVAMDAISRAIQTSARITRNHRGAIVLDFSRQALPKTREVRS